jgi:hypothetical protein
MASTMEMFFGTTALIVNTFVIIIMFFVSNIVLAPILNWYSNSTITSASASVLAPWDMTYIFPAIFGFLIIYEIVIVIVYFAIIGRKVEVDDYY